MSDSDYMTRQEVQNYVKFSTSELVWGALGGAFLGIGVIFLMNTIFDVGVSGLFTADAILGWAGFIVIGVAGLFLMQQNRRKRKALE